jgi:hypothetical protein
MPRTRKGETERYYIHGRTSFLQKQRERMAGLVKQRQKEVETSLRKNRQFMSRVEFLEYMEATEDHLGKLRSLTYYVEGVKRLLWLNMQLTIEIRKWEKRWDAKERYEREQSRKKEEARNSDIGSEVGERKPKAKTGGRTSASLRDQLEKSCPAFEEFAGPALREEDVTRGDRDALVAYRRSKITERELRGNRRRGGKSFAAGSIKIDRAGGDRGDD